ncbi:PTS transporter subunit EIIC [Spiroplasma culicicola]|uniref:PTS system glucose-specific IIBC component n=1 Tax=Spiroplasma culicicola AES-1 TaxID=1276246 RepID=W6A7M8_9MOLU|nr:PTS transporter subunit EIIC [Spiroplasma culicicola]AHI52865.1 PTS system glucose-specific IIBC component [Spiroplasma culicicola AES-1]
MTRSEFDKNFELSWYTKNNYKTFLQKLSKSFGFVIILMPIFGILLSIGSIIDNYSNNEIAQKLFKNIGSILFSNIGIWFCLAIVIGFANNKGAAIYSALIFYLIFNVSISAFIVPSAEIPDQFNILFWKKLNSKIYLTNIFGINTFNTGVIGGLFCGTIATINYRIFKDIKLIKGLEFFAQEKFVLIMTPIFSLLCAFIFMIIWPMIGWALMSFGVLVAKSPVGVDSFIFRTLQRMLIPFGSSLLWQAPMWYTDIGGNLINYQDQLLVQYLNRTNADLSSSPGILEYILEQNVFGDQLYEALKEKLETNQELFSIIDNWFSQTNQLGLWDLRGDQIISAGVLHNEYVTIQDCWNSGLRVTRFLTGGFVNSMFVLPTIAVVIFLRIPKDKRKQHIGMYSSAILTSFLLGITEPIEYIFCYLNPIFFFAIYAPLTGVIGAITSLLELKIGTTFSTGLFDLIFQGIIPTINGQNTRIWILPILGICFGAIVFTISYFYFKAINFDPLTTNVQQKYIDKQNIVQLKLFFLNFKNIEAIKKENNKLNIKLKKSIEVNQFDYWFISIEKQNLEYYFVIKENYITTIELFIEIYNSKNNLNTFKVENKKQFLEFKKQFVKQNKK